MERENFTPNELTGQAQNAYSSGMPENSGGIGENSPQTPNIPPVQFNSEQVQAVADLNRIMASETTPIEVRRAAAQSLSDMSNPGGKRERSGGRRGEAQEQATKFPTFDASEFTDPTLSKIVFQLSINKENIIKDRALLREYKNQVEQLVSTGTGETKEQAEKLLEKLNVADAFSKERADSTSENNIDAFRLYLTRDDMSALVANPMTWLGSELDKIYAFTSEGSEQDSSQVNEVQSRVAKATSYLAGTDLIKDNPKLLEKFNEEFNSRLFMLFARSSVQQRNMEGVQGLSKRLQTHGMLNTLSFDDGLVGSMHNRIQDLYDDVRVRSFKQHITPEAHSQIQQAVIEEYLKLAYIDEDLAKRLLREQEGPEGGEMAYSDVRKRKLLESAVTLAVRTGYDHFVASQREAVIVARGQALPTDEDLAGILADPSGLFNAFNYEQLLVAKFGLLNEHQEVYFRSLKRRYAESVLNAKFEKDKKGDINSWVKSRVEIDPSLKTKVTEHEGHETRTQRTDAQIREEALVTYGQALFKDLMLVNDFYSSPWRIEQFMSQLDDIFKDKIAAAGDKKISDLSGEEIKQAEEKAGNFGLFMRLRMIQGSPIVPDGEKKAAKIETWGKIATYRPEDVVKIFREREGARELDGINDSFRNIGLSLSPEEEKQGVKLYDKFKDKYGYAIKYVREKGFAGDSPEQIDFSQILNRPDYANLLDDILGKGEAAKVAEIFSAMKGFAGNGETINKLISDVRFEDIYSRAYAVDDALLNRMEKSDERKTGLLKVSRKLSPESGGDAFVRTFNDAKNAAEAATAFLKFLRSESTEEKLKASLEAAELTSFYSSPNARAKVFRYTFGSHMLMGALVEKGRSGKAGTLYEVLDWKSRAGRKPVNELQEIFGPQADAYNNDQMLHFLDEHRVDLVGSHGEEMWEEMRTLARTKAKDRSRMTLYKFLIFAMIWLGYEAFHDTAETLKEGLKSDELK